MIYLQRVIILLLLVHAMTSVELETCTLCDCPNCIPLPSGEYAKEVFCEGTKRLPSNNTNESFESSGYYSIKEKSANPAEVYRLVLRGINVGKDFKLNLTGMENISSLLIENSVIKHIDTHLLVNIKHLVILDSKILELYLSDLTNLSTIYIRDAASEELIIEKSVNNLKLLVFKNLRLNEMDIIQNLISLSELTLENNEILFIDKPYFSALLTLKTLSIRSNRFLNASIGAEMFKNLGNLVHLDLTGNGIEFMSTACFKDLSDLEILNLNHNGLKEISWVFFTTHMKKLDSLSMRNNSINSIVFSENTRNLTCIRKIDFSFNLIRKIEKYTFWDHYRLVDLDLKNNLVEKFHVNSLDNLKNLTYFNMDRQMNGNIRQTGFNRTVGCGEVILEN